MQSLDQLNLEPPFQLQMTADGSPSLEFFHSEDLHETMHHSGGAFTESLYIYSSALEKAIEAGWLIRILSVGLGTGYNEIQSVALCLSRGITIEALDSYEAVPQLRSGFTSWLNGEESPFNKIYSYILERSAEHFEVGADEVKFELARLLNLNEALQTDGFTRHNSSVIFYDMYSRKMNEEHWQEGFFKNFLSSVAAENCVFTTYAATGNLRRALQNQGFDLLERAGFSGKRQSTLAIRN